MDYPTRSTGVEETCPLSKFHPFVRLPPELRVMIWKEASQHSRLVNFISDMFLIGHCKKRKSTTAPPPLLYACRESREIVLDMYVNINKSKQTMPVFLNPHFDKLMIVRGSIDDLIPWIKDLDVSQVRQAAFLYEDIGLDPADRNAAAIHRDDEALFDWVSSENPVLPKLDRLLGTWVPGTQRFVDVVIQLWQWGAKNLEEISILMSPPRTETMHPCRTRFSLVDHANRERGEERRAKFPLLCEMERALQTRLEDKYPRTRLDRKWNPPGKRWAKGQVDFHFCFVEGEAVPKKRQPRVSISHRTDCDKTLGFQAVCFFSHWQFHDVFFNLPLHITPRIDNTEPVYEPSARSTLPRGFLASWVFDWTEVTNWNRNRLKRQIIPDGVEKRTTDQGLWGEFIAVPRSRTSYYTSRRIRSVPYRLRCPTSPPETF